MNIGIDIDNVISNFNEELLKVYMEHDKELRNTGIINKNAPYIRNGMFDWTDEEEKTFYKENIERIAINLKAIEGASKYIKKLKQDGHTIYIISGRDNGEYTDPYNMTKNWLEKYDIVYDKLFLVDAYNSHSKTEICLENNVDIMIDDSKRMCTDIKKHGIRAFIMDTPYNRDTNEFKRVRSWEEIYNIISNNKINVILDTDTYNECDDQFALSYLIKSQDKFNIEAITVAPYSHNTRNYEKIINLCDLMCTTKVFTIDKRLIDLMMRRGAYSNTQYHIKETYKLKEYFDNLLGHNLYDLFSEIKENL